uniref:Uncharacterized protein n=1 Tax=Clandestinovirus TaxID=2831644 RepID=A0A8F8KTA8_9VIRU|nr:hypothetical protein KOM_12_18 [Clandestinovirus]
MATPTITKSRQTVRGLFNKGFNFTQTEYSKETQKTKDAKTQWDRCNDYRENVLYRGEHHKFDNGKLSIQLSHWGSSVLAWSFTYVDTLLYIHRPGIEVRYISVLPQEKIVFAIGKDVVTSKMRAFVCNLTNGKCLEFDDFDLHWYDVMVGIGFKNERTVFIRKNAHQIEWNIESLY